MCIQRCGGVKGWEILGWAGRSCALRNCLREENKKPFLVEERNMKVKRKDMKEKRNADEKAEGM